MLAEPKKITPAEAWGMIETGRAPVFLEEYDFTDLHIHVGGIRAWQEAGLPLEKKV